MAFRYPVDQVNITQGFGDNPDYYAQFGQSGHNGTDLGCPIGTPVYAAEAGTVYFEGWGINSSWMGSIAGICVIIDHGSVYTGYAHMSSTTVDKGQVVSKGQLIGYSGSTGTSTGGHVHFEFISKPPQWSNGYAGRINPSQFMSGSTAGEDMTPNFIRRTYYMVQGREPEQSEVDFHMANSTPESFINGFGDIPLWKTLADKPPVTIEKVVTVDRPVEVIKEVIKEVPVEKIVTKEVPIGFDQLSIGDLLSEIYHKLFHIGKKENK